MATARRRESGEGGRRVLVSSTAANMIASLHPFNRAEADAALETVTSSVLDPARVERIVGVENAYVARVEDLRVLFRNEGDSIVITSVVTKG